MLAHTAPEPGDGKASPRERDGGSVGKVVAGYHKDLSLGPSAEEVETVVPP